VTRILQLVEKILAGLAYPKYQSTGLQALLMRQFAVAEIEPAR
jgi:hypothetical protein